MKINYIYQLVIILSAGLFSGSAIAQTTQNGGSAMQPRESAESETAIIVEPTEEQAENDLATDPQVLASIQRYADRVLQLEVENGAYNSELVEELVGLGLAYANAGNHQQALDVFSRALHINRVNEGLQNTNQLPILEQIIQANSELQDNDALNNNFGYMLWVYSRNYPKDDMRLVPVYTRAANWNMQAYDMTQPPDSMRHLVIAANFFSKAVDVIERSRGNSDPELIKPLYGIVNANFKLVEPFGFVSDIDAFSSGKLNPLMPSNFDSAFDQDPYMRNPYRALDYNQEHLSRLLEDQKYTFSLVQNSYKSGRNALLRIIEIHNMNPDLPALSKAYAHTHLGDWYLRFYKRSNAVEHYGQAYQILSESEYAEAAIAEIFGRPRSLGVFEQPPEFNIVPYKVLSVEEIKSEDDLLTLDEDEREKTNFVLVEFNVTQYGAVRNLQILDSNPPDNVRFRRMARNTINSTPFRPRVDAGQPIETENVRMLYRFQ